MDLFFILMFLNQFFYFNQIKPCLILFIKKIKIQFTLFYYIIYHLNFNYLVQKFHFLLVIKSL